MPSCDCPILTGYALLVLALFEFLAEVLSEFQLISAFLLF